MSTKKTKASAPKPPTLLELVARAGRCFAALTAKIQEFSQVYVLAGELYGPAGKKAIREKYPLYTDSSWELVEAIGKGRLLPQFFLSSRHFANGLLRLENSLDKQMSLLGMVRDSNGVAKIEVVNAASGKVEFKSFDELSRYAEDSILFALNEGSSADEIRKFAREYRMAFTRRDTRPDWERIGDDIKINHRFTMSLSDWQTIGRTMGWRTA